MCVAVQMQADVHGYRYKKSNVHSAPAIIIMANVLCHLLCSGSKCFIYCNSFNPH